MDLLSRGSNPEFSTLDWHQNIEADFRFRQRRHRQWTKNYDLYRDTVITNRLTERQSVNVQALQAKNQRLSEMGVPDINNPLLGETYAELNEQLYRTWNPTTKKEIKRVPVRADNELIMDRPLQDILRVDFLPYVSLASDVERELKNRGVQDIFIACVDGLKGFPEAIETVFPEEITI